MNQDDTISQGLRPIADKLQELSSADSIDELVQAIDTLASIANPITDHPKALDVISALQELCLARIDEIEGDRQTVTA